MQIRKWLALLVSAALALSLLAGCGNGSKALSDVIADLLSGQYNNVTVEVDPDLTAALKKAASAGDTQEEVLAALVENLSLSGGSITFNNLGDGQQGQHGVTLTFQPGSDPDAAARSAFTEWNRVFSSLPDDGSYRAHVSMIEAEGGYYIAVDVEVLKAGSHDKDDSDDDEDDGPGYTETVENETTTYTVTTGQGLKEVAAEVNTLQDTSSIVIKLQNDITLPGSWTPIGEVDEDLSGGGFDGTLDGQDHTITMGSVPSIDLAETLAYAGLFGAVGSQGQIKNLTIQGAKIDISSPMGIAGALAAICFGTIEDCTVQNVAIDVTSTTAGAFAGGLVGSIGYDGKIIDCSVKNSTIYATATAADAYAGGLAAGIGNNAIIEGTCTVTGLTVEAESPSGTAYAGGILSMMASTSGGLNPTNFTWNSCTIKASSDTGSAWAGGIVGRFYETSLLDCHWHSQGSVTAAVGETNATADSTNPTAKKGSASAGTLTGGNSEDNPLGINS